MISPNLSVRSTSDLLQIRREHIMNRKELSIITQQQKLQEHQNQIKMNYEHVNAFYATIMPLINMALYKRVLTDWLTDWVTDYFLTVCTQSLTALSQVFQEV